MQMRRRARARQQGTRRDGRRFRRQDHEVVFDIDDAIRQLFFSGRALCVNGVVMARAFRASRSMGQQSTESEGRCARKFQGGGIFVSFVSWGVPLTQSLYDLAVRSRQVQSPAPQGGRLVGRR